MAIERGRHGIDQDVLFQELFQGCGEFLSFFNDCDGSTRDDNNGAELIGHVEFRERGCGGECGQEAPSGDYRGMSFSSFASFLVQFADVGWL